MPVALRNSRTHDEIAESIQQDLCVHRDTIAAFHRAWYSSLQTWNMTSFEGVPVLKNPMDLWVLQEIIWELRPTLIVETGSGFGGSALFYMRCLERQERHARVISIDASPWVEFPVHPGIAFIRGDSIDPKIITRVEKNAHGHRTMVLLDSSHHCDHVLAELDAYAPLVSCGQVLVVEDTNLDGRPIDTSYGGPGAAVDQWLPDHPEFQRNLIAERYLFTLNPGGCLLKVA